MSSVFNPAQVRNYLEEHARCLYQNGELCQLGYVTGYGPSDEPFYHAVIKRDSSADFEGSTVGPPASNTEDAFLGLLSCTTMMLGGFNQPDALGPNGFVDNGHVTDAHYLSATHNERVNQPDTLGPHGFVDNGHVTYAHSLGAIHNERINHPEPDIRGETKNDYVIVDPKDFTVQSSIHGNGAEMMSTAENPNHGGTGKDPFKNSGLNLKYASSDTDTDWVFDDQEYMESKLASLTLSAKADDCEKLAITTQGDGGDTTEPQQHKAGPGRDNLVGAGVNLLLRDVTPLNLDALDLSPEGPWERLDNWLQYGFFLGHPFDSGPGLVDQHGHVPGEQKGFRAGGNVQNAEHEADYGAQYNLDEGPEPPALVGTAFKASMDLYLPCYHWDPVLNTWVASVQPDDEMNYF